MNRSIDTTRVKNGSALLILVAFICILGGGSASGSTATKDLSNVLPMLGISVINNSNREIRHLYLSPVDQNNWGPDLLGGQVVRTGESFTITDAVCSGNEIKVIAEDQQGCFLYGVVSCAQSTTSWTITNETPVDCGS